MRPHRGYESHPSTFTIPASPMFQTQNPKNFSQAKSPAPARVVVRSTLRSRVHLPKNRRLAQELVWQWVQAKWPRLVPAPSDMERSHFERALPGQAVSVSTSADGLVWTLAVAHDERGGARTWMTRAQVADAGDADVLGLQTSCSDPGHAPMVVAPPRLLGTWVERLELEDGGIAVLGEAREVSSPEQLMAFCDHVLSGRRSLPVIALANKPGSRFYGVDPRGLAEAVRGLAHVACLTPELAARVKDRLAENFGVLPGAARIYAPHFSAQDTAEQHPLVRDNTSPAAKDPGAFRRLLCRQICALSASTVVGNESLLQGSL